MICYNCEKQIRDRSGNKRKVDGVWVHKRCPGQKSYRQMKREKNNGNR
jgi:hypothetical protein